MEWYHVISILFPIAGMIWVMHRENSKEMKDFHGRLCKLEEKYIQVMQNYWKNN
jgi:DNA-binding ferritin-like protein (Dps family)